MPGADWPAPPPFQWLRPAAGLTRRFDCLIHWTMWDLMVGLEVGLEVGLGVGLGVGLSAEFSAD